MKIIAGHQWTGGFWFRIFGIGLRIIDRLRYPAPFSERTGAAKAWRIGRWSVKVLR